MTPPTDPTGDEFPDFDRMTPDEQMAWLESLARRQGADDDELTTAADVDIPVPDNPVHDEPGYIPFEGSRSGREWARHQRDAVAADEDAHSAAVENADESELVDFDDLTAPGDAADPMHWLDSLAAQTGAEPDSPSESAGIAEDGAAAQAGAGAEGTGDDVLGGVDPLAWLETLARRQGANLSELTTPADLEIETVPDDAVVDEPGYVPFEGSRSAREMGLTMDDRADEVMPAPADDAAPDDVRDDLPRAQAGEDASDAYDRAVDVSAEAGSPDETPADALQAGSPADELAAVAEWEASLMADEPLESGREWDLRPAEQDTPAAADHIERARSDAPPEDAASNAELAAVAEWEADMDDLDDPLAGADPMTWLESLAKRQGASEDELTTAADLDVPAPPDDVMLDEPGYVPFSALDILPPDQDVPEDIFAEAERLSSQAEDADVALNDEFLAWLEEIAVEPGADAAEYLALRPEEGEGASYVASDPLAGLSDDAIAAMQARGELSGEQELAWLQRRAAQLAADHEDMTGRRLPDTRPTGRQEEPAETLGVGTHHEHTQPLPDLGISDSELEAFLAADLEPPADELDSLAKALDDEYERLLVGDETEPDWYTEAVARATSDETVAGEPALTAAQPVEPPSWLEVTDEAGQGLSAADLPDWLMEAGFGEQPPEAAIPGWLVEQLVEAEADAESGDLNDWLRDMEPGAIEPPPALGLAAAGATRRTSAPSEHPRNVTASAPLPQDARYEPFRRRLQGNPNDHVGRLELARSLRADQDVGQSLDQYEVLVEASQLLDTVADDLAALTADYGEAPRAHRLLGDAQMRRGQLQAALDAYRAALERL